MKENDVLIIVGPTAVGKTELSLVLAEKWGGEVVSADSRQIYRHLNIGTAKPDLVERTRVPHHFIDICDPDQNYSAGQFGTEARQCIDQIFLRNAVPIVVGGSGFYIRALVDGLFAPRLSDPEIKRKWHQRISEQSITEVFEILRQVDPDSAAVLHPNDHQRVVRALEVYDISGRPLSYFKTHPAEPAGFSPVFIGLERERAALYRRIEQRVDRMIGQGLIEEVRFLKSRGWGIQLNALRTVGYQEVFAFLAGQIDESKMIAQIKMNSRRYAKRQLTWFRKDPRIRWIDVANQAFPELYDAILKKIRLR